MAYITCTHLPRSNRDHVPVEASHHEVAPSQHEIKLTRADALSMADAVTTFRSAVEEVAREQGVFATLMPTPPS